MGKPTHLIPLSPKQRRHEFAQLQVELLMNNSRADQEATAKLRRVSEELFDAIEKIFAFFPAEAAQFLPSPLEFPLPSFFPTFPGA